MNKRPWHDLRWHWPSDQPDQIRFPKRPIRQLALPEYAATAATAVLGAPLVAAAWATLRPGPIPAMADLLGVAENPTFDPAVDAEILALARNLGVRRVLLRFPVWERDRLPYLIDFAEKLRAITGAPLLIAVLQNRASVVEPRRWRADLANAFDAFGPLAEAFQVLQAPNRTKWACYHPGDAFALLEDAERVRARFPGVRLAGPGVIDFEPAPLMRLLLNQRRFRLDVVSALLYVDRRGSPRNTQYGIFDLDRKIRFTAAVAKASARCRTVDGRPSPLWLTETNWPLLGTDIWTPTSDEECVREDVAADYLEDYARIAAATGLVERVYWWQLVAPGYGLVDRRPGLRARPAYERMRALLTG